MITEVEHFDFLDNLILEKGLLHLIFGYGTGDTFNAMVHLAKAPPMVPYSMIIKKPQLDLVLYLIGLFGKGPTKLIVVDYWKHDFAQQISIRFPGLSIQRKFEPNMRDTGLVACWATPSLYNKILPHTPEDVEVIRAYFSSSSINKTLPKGSVILFPTAGTQFNDFKPDWVRIVDQLKGLGIQNIYSNISGVMEYGDELIEGTTPLQLNHRELINTVYSTKNIKFIAVRSGVLDILRFCHAKALILYQPQPEGIFETCRFGLIPNEMDSIETICLPNSKDHQDAIISYYVKYFIASPLLKMNGDIHDEIT